ncbi:MAG: DUF523 domain-containing protein [Candidatus Gribaldobacteria bacterium]|nr:DUF523 domain-containing protein [Candidatus Gribaldobacteria bacterium]
MPNQKKILCSACLLGVKCRYDGQSKPNEKVLALSKKEILIPVCPEQLGGLPIPRVASETTASGEVVLAGQGKVVTKQGDDVTENFIKGAQEVLKLAKTLDIEEAILKQRSPSCGSCQIYDGSFSKTVVKGDGVTAALLKQNGIKVISEEDL